jgi:hypothetical protein
MKQSFHNFGYSDGQMDSMRLTARAKSSDDIPISIAPAMRVVESTLFLHFFFCYNSLILDNIDSSLPASVIELALRF